LNPTILQIVSYLAVLVMGGGGGAAIIVAIINRRPKRAMDAEAALIEAQADKVLADVRLHASEEWERLFSRLRSEIDRQDAELDKQALQIITLRKEGHRVRNFASSLEGFGRALMKHIDLLEDMIRGLGAVPPERPNIDLPTLGIDAA
jgi:uncharacterized membrane protein YgaE (UPF0421/DUF939 family)